MALQLIDRTRGETSRERVYGRLRGAITSAELVPGRRLSENELAGQLGVSRTPIREALALTRTVIEPSNDVYIALWRACRNAELWTPVHTEIVRDRLGLVTR